jgi:hypothetical protein
MTPLTITGVEWDASVESTEVEVLRACDRFFSSCAHRRHD